MKHFNRPILRLTLGAAALAVLLPAVALADDAPSPCAALKRIVAAAPDGFTGLSQAEVNGVAQPYGDDAQCTASHDSYQCLWTPHHDAGSSADALQSVAADIASCLPDATHDHSISIWERAASARRLLRRRLGLRSLGWW
jgi:hypothetical protein